MTADAKALLPLARNAIEANGQQPLIETVERYALVLLIAALVGMGVRRMQIPYAIALVIGGLVIEASHVAGVPAFDPDVLLFVFLPPLLFDAAFRIDAKDVRPLVTPILVLAVPGVFLTALIVGGLLYIELGLPLAISLLFGAVVAATDPVAVLGIFGQLNVPRRLSLIAESESLVNDGMAVTLYVVLLEWVASGHFSLQASLSTFALEVVGGVSIGCAVGFGSSWLTRFVDDHLIEMLLSVSIAYGSYLVASELGASGPLACVAAGYLHGSYGRSIGMSANTRQVLDDLWEFLGFIANAIVFLVLGVTVHLRDLVDDLWPITLAIVAVLVARGCVTLATGGVTGRGRHPARTWKEAILLTWGGLRGALTAALVMALPDDVPHRETLVAMAFGVVVFTLVAQGLTLPLLIRRLSPNGKAAET